MGFLHWVIILYVGTAALCETMSPEYLEMLRATKNDEEFARLMGIEDVALVRESSEHDDPAMNLVSELGDILLTKEQEEKARQGLNFNRYGGNKWRNDEIPYVISDSDFTSSQKNHINSAITALSNRLNRLKIVPRRNQDDYVMVISGNGCYSNLGRVGGQQTLSLQSRGCLSVGTIQHEFIHAAGFTHEHNRSDRDDYVKVLWENIHPNWRSQYQKVNERDFGNQGPYDYYSVMHYPMNAPGSREKAFQILQSNVNEGNIGQRTGATDTDVRKVNVLYP